MRVNNPRTAFYFTVSIRKRRLQLSIQFLRQSIPYGHLLKKKQEKVLVCFHSLHVWRVFFPFPHLSGCFTASFISVADFHSSFFFLPSLLSLSAALSPREAVLCLKGGKTHFSTLTSFKGLWQFKMLVGELGYDTSAVVQLNSTIHIKRKYKPYFLGNLKVAESSCQKEKSCFRGARKYYLVRLWMKWFISVSFSNYRGKNGKAHFQGTEICITTV